MTLRGPSRTIVVEPLAHRREAPAPDAPVVAEHELGPHDRERPADRERGPARERPRALDGPYGPDHPAESAHR